MSNKTCFFAALSTLLLLPLQQVNSDTIIFNNGTQMSCVVIVKDDKNLLAETEFGTVTLKRNAVQEVKLDSDETNLILRGDFFKKKGNSDDALQMYGEALTKNPKSELARSKYAELRKSMDEYNRQLLLGFSKKDDEDPTKITQEHLDAAKAEKKLNPTQNISFQSQAFGSFPLVLPTGADKDKLAIQYGKMEALRKVFPKGIGYGFKASGDKVEILQEGDIPNCKIEVTKKEKTTQGYNITVTIQGPVETIMLDLPDDYPITEATGSTEDIKAENRQEVRIRAMDSALLDGVKQVIKAKNAGDKKSKKKYFGRVFLVGVENEALTPNGYFMRVKLKVWIDPMSEA